MMSEGVVGYDAPKAIRHISICAMVAPSKLYDWETAAARQCAFCCALIFGSPEGQRNPSDLHSKGRVLQPDMHAALAGQAICMHPM